uniref:Ovule protein n=1 Tax=Mesocestoides corti TaxID=53468 RepID=A0A5K3EW40_MESCO
MLWCQQKDCLRLLVQSECYLECVRGYRCDRPICKALYIRVLLHYPYWFILRKNSRIVLRLKEDLRSVYFSYTISRTYF